MWDSQLNEMRTSQCGTKTKANTNLFTQVRRSFKCLWNTRHRYISIYVSMHAIKLEWNKKYLTRVNQHIQENSILNLNYVSLCWLKFNKSGQAFENRIQQTNKQTQTVSFIHHNFSPERFSIEVLKLNY